MVFVIMPIFLSLGSTIVLDILNHMMAKETKNQETTIKIDHEERKRREKIPKRATMINCGLMIFALIVSAIPLKSFDLDLETRTLLLVVPVSLLNAIRNPLIARLAFQVNRKIRQESVEERRQAEIKTALEKRTERQKANEVDVENECGTQKVIDKFKEKAMKRY